MIQDYLLRLVVVGLFMGSLFYFLPKSSLQVRKPTNPPPSTIVCSGKPTKMITDGGYDTSYKAGSPETTIIVTNNTVGKRLTLTGYVFDTHCKPISHAWLDFWQADGNGNYDMNGYSLRGHEYSDSSGHYTLQTVIPGEYPTRTSHIHVKIRAADTSPTFVTQLFLPGIPGNNADGFYDSSLVISMTGTKEATFNFVVGR